MLLRESIRLDPGPGLLLTGGASDIPLSLDVVKIALAQARARAVRTHMTNQEPTLAATGAVAEVADEVSAVDFEDPAASAAWAARRVAAGERFDVVLGVREMAQLATAEIAEALGLPGNPPAAVHRVRTKDACRAALAAAGFTQPAVRLCRNAGDAEEFLRDTAGPWVVKPRDGMGSEGVSLVDGPADLPRALAVLPDGKPFLIEEFVSGPEFSVEGVFLGGSPTVLAVTAKEKAEPPFFVEVGHVLPAEIPTEARADIERQVTAALTALDLRYGLFHVELWQTPDGVVLGEVHVRNGGGWIHRLLAHAIPGLEMFGLVYDDALGRPVDKPSAPVRGAATRFLTAGPGRLIAVEGWDRVLAHPSVLHAELTIAPGAVIRPLQSGGDRLGAVVVGADTPAEARTLARELADSVRFVVEAEGESQCAE